VAIFDGIELENRSKAFKGGSMFSWFGGIAVDLREAELAPNAHLDLHSVFGGIAIRVPRGWRVETRTRGLGAGVAVDVPDPEDAHAPTLTVDGLAAFGGIAIAAKSPAS